MSLVGDVLPLCVHAALKVPTLAAFTALARGDETRFKPLIAQLGLRM